MAPHPARVRAMFSRVRWDPLRAHSSIGQSPRLITGLFLVRTQVGPPLAPQFRPAPRSPPARSRAARVNMVEESRVEHPGADSRARKSRGDDAELKTLDDQLTQERGTLTALKGSLKRLDDKLKPTPLSVAATDKQRGELIADVRADDAAARSLARQAEPSRDRARVERRAARARGAAQARPRPRGRNRRSSPTDGDAARVADRGDGGRGQEAPGRARRARGRHQLQLGDVESSSGEAKPSATTVVKQLPPVLYRRYDAVRVASAARASRRRPTAPARPATCPLPPQLFHRLRREPMLEQCPSCNRIIYFAAASPGRGRARAKQALTRARRKRTASGKLAEDRPLKSCPQCQRVYPNDAGFCPVDGIGLAVREHGPRRPSRTTRASARASAAATRSAASSPTAGWGASTRASTSRTNSRIAVKVLHDDVAKDDVALERFKREYEIQRACRTTTSSMCSTSSATRRAASWLLVMEFLDGEELRVVLKREKTIAARAPRPDAVAGRDRPRRGARDADFVHRDLKPDNVFLCGTREGDIVEAPRLRVRQGQAARTRRSSPCSARPSAARTTWRPSRRRGSTRSTRAPTSSRSARSPTSA